MSAVEQSDQGEGIDARQRFGVPDDTSNSAERQHQPTVWLAQFKEDVDWISNWTSKAVPGSELPWKIGKTKINAMNEGDPVIYWRTITKGRDRGGIVGTGRVIEATAVTDESGGPRVRTEVVEFFNDAPIGRDEVLSETGLRHKFWQFSLLGLPSDVANEMDRLLRAKNHIGIYRQTIPTDPTNSSEIVFLADAPKSDEDFLGRGELAFLLAARLNLIWDETNRGVKETSLPSRAKETALQIVRRLKSLFSDGSSKPSASDQSEAAQTYDAGFVVHVDAPWGGGKTSFANYLRLILNPYNLSGPLPEVLEAVPLDDINYWPKDFRRPWHVVMFNAWQHQHVDPPWWCFYQAIRRQVFGSRVWEKNEQRANPQIPEPHQDYAYSSFPNRLLFGFWSWLKEFFWRLFTPELRNRGLITVLTLGLAILFVSLGWLQVDTEEGILEGNFIEKSGAIATIIAILAGSGSFVWTIVTTVTSTLFAGTPDAARNYSLGGGDPLERFRRHFARSIRALERPVLVIVDDLDRCDPKFVVELVRGMQTILRSPRVVFLLLGDRDWIEHAFAETHQVMEGIDVGPEHSFGGRFVEKAIQLSVVLPDIPPDERSAYVRKLLGVDGGEVGPVESLDVEQRSHVEQSLETLSATEDPVKRDKSAADIREQVFKFDSISDDVKEAVAKVIDRKMALRSAADSRVQSATQHRLEPLSSVLPPNPRQIKRIINAISLSQEIARIRMEVQPDTQRWRQMALWIVLMTEWPQTWVTLAKWPDLVTLVHDQSAKKTIDGIDAFTAQTWSDAIRAKTDVMKLIDYPTVSSAPNSWKDCRIDADTIRMLNVVLPPTSGEPLPIPS